eukprot:g10685.t1
MTSLAGATLQKGPAVRSKRRGDGRGSGGGGFLPPSQMANPDTAAASQLSSHDVSCSPTERAVTSSNVNTTTGVRIPSTPPMVTPGHDGADGGGFCGGGGVASNGDGLLFDRLGSAATANVSGSSSSSSSSGSSSGSDSISRRAQVTGGKGHGAGSASTPSGSARSSSGHGDMEDGGDTQVENVNVSEATSVSAASTATNPFPAPAGLGGRRELSPSQAAGGVWGSSAAGREPSAVGAGMGARPKTSILRQTSGDLVSLVAAQEREGAVPPGLSEPSGAGVGIGMGAKSKTSFLRQSSGDLVSLMASQQREGGGVSGLGGRGPSGEIKSPATLPGTSTPWLPRTPDPNFYSPSVPRRGCAEVASPRPRLSLSAANGGPSSGSGTITKDVVTGGREGWLGRAPGRDVPKSHSSAAAARGALRTEDGDVSPLLPPLVPTTTTTATTTGGGGGGGVGGGSVDSVSSAVPERKEVPSAEDRISPPEAETTVQGADESADNHTQKDEPGGVLAPARGGEATCGKTLPADGRGRVGRDYGPGIPITRVSSWSALGDDESGGVVFAGNAVVGGSGTGAVISQSPAREREGVPTNARLRPALLLTGERERPRLEDVCGAGSQSSPTVERTAANQSNGKASFVSEEDRAIEAAQAGDIPVMQAFLDRGGYVELRDSRVGMTLLGWAARRGHVELARMLLFNGASVTSRDGRERTPLHRACSGCHVGIVEVLLEHGADPNARDATWRTPLHRAARWGSPGCSNLLLDAGADIEARDKELARTPLHFASRSGGLETTLVLLNNGADFNAKTVAGNTPLHLACDRGLVGNVKLLLEWGADADAKNEAGAIPAEVAAPWVEDSVKASMQELLTSRPPEGPDAYAAIRNRPQPAVIRPRPEGAAEREAGLMESIRLQRNSQAGCPECQQDILRQTHTFNSDGVPVAPSNNHIHATRRSSSIRSSSKLKICSTHRSRALPGEGGLPGLDDELGLRGLGSGLVGGGVGGGVTGLGDGEDEFRSRRGMGKTRKKQLSSNTKYEGGYRHGGCCSMQ